jgi:hypothetical protein
MQRASIEAKNVTIHTWLRESAPSTQSRRSRGGSLLLQLE